MKSLKELLSENSNLSHKRFVSVLSFIVLIVLSFLSAYGHDVNDSFIWVFASLSGAESLLTVLEKINKKK